MASHGARFARRLMPLVLGFVWAPAGTAQDLRPGHRLRVTVPRIEGSPVIGELVRLDQDSLVLERDGQLWAVPRTLVIRTESFNGTRGHARGGAWIGGLAAAAWVAASGSECSGSYSALCAPGFVVVTLAGAGVGAMIGTAFRRDEWIVVSLESTGSGHPANYAGDLTVSQGWRQGYPDAVASHHAGGRQRLSVAVVLPYGRSGGSGKSGAPSN